MRALICLFCSTILAGCAGFIPSYDGGAEFPPVSWIPCCWQSQEQMTIGEGEQSRTFTAVTARLDQGLTIVLLDSLGRKVGTLFQKEQSFYMESEFLDEQFPVKLFGLGFYLRHALESDWTSLGYELLEREGVVDLIYEDQTLVSMHTPDAVQPILFIYPETGVRVQVIEVSRQIL